MKPKILIAACAAAVFTSAASLSAAALRPTLPALAPETPASGTAAESEPSPAASDGYLVGAWRGFVAVYAGTLPEPAYVSGVTVASLRSNDRALLEQGIAVDSLDAAAMLIEDFSG